MIVIKTFNLRRLLQFSGHHLVWLTLWMTSVVLLYEYTDLQWLSIPWLPLSIIGTAVAFYVGFKNNSAYDRMWEARKIWGAIVNSSRAWGSYIKSFVTLQANSENISGDAIFQIKKKLIYRHIAWLYALRSQLLVVKSWEHASQKGMIGKAAKKHKREYGLGRVVDELTATELHHFLPDEEYDRMIAYRNTATQIIDQQATDLATLRKKNLVNDFTHVELQKLLYDCYEHQGKAERIKNFPLPRQYATMSIIFIGIFIFLLPFGMVPQFADLGQWGIWLSIPFTVLLGWIYVVMEIVGDYSENPFQGMSNDIPMLSLCRIIENDLREMLGEANLPDEIQPKDGVLM